MVTSKVNSLDLEESDETVTLRLNRPEKRNAIDIELVTELNRVMERLHEEASKGLLLTGAGPVTCAGADTAIVTGTSQRVTDVSKRFFDLHHLVHTYPAPTVMSCRGALVGAGFQLTIACDFAVAGEDTIFSKPEIQYALSQEYSTRMIEHVLGVRAAKEVLLRGEPIDASRAYEYGLLSDVVPEREVERTAQTLLEELVCLDLETYRELKRTLTFSRSPAEFGDD